jgi:hypothetical protein
MKLSMSDCFGCHEVISLVGIGPGEDDTIPYRVDLPPGHKVMSQYADRVRIKCPEGVASWIRWTSPNVDPGALKAARMLRPEDTVEHETWLEYHDRLVREYFDGERELLKEIYPDRVPVRRRSIQFKAPWPGLAAAWFLVGLVNLFALDNLILAVVWFVLATGVLSVGIVRR